MITATAPFSWEVDAVGFYREHQLIFAGAALAYYPVVFGIKRALSAREPFDLGGGKTTCRINWIFWCRARPAPSTGGAGAINVVPMMLEPMVVDGRSFTETVCSASTFGWRTDPRSWWSFLFNVSKVAEFGDTLFVVLRKKPLILLQHYHHLATMLYCWYGTLHVFKYNNTNVFFTAMNLSVHSIMYSWYAATRTGWQSPKLLMMGVTMLQLAQMVAGCVIVATSVYGGAEHGCGRWAQEDPVGLGGCFFMYFSYLVLFGQLFIGNYVTPKKKKKKNV